MAAATARLHQAEAEIDAELLAERSRRSTRSARRPERLEPEHPALARPGHGRTAVLSGLRAVRVRARGHEPDLLVVQKPEPEPEPKPEPELVPVPEPEPEHPAAEAAAATPATARQLERQLMRWRRMVTVLLL